MPGFSVLVTAMHKLHGFPFSSAGASPCHKQVPFNSLLVLDGLLDVDDELGMTRLAWLRRGATAATREVLKAELAKLEFLRAHGADRLDLSTPPAGRPRMLAETGRRSTNQALQRADVDRRHPILLATLAETYVEVLDDLVQLPSRAPTPTSMRGQR